MKAVVFSWAFIDEGSELVVGKYIKSLWPNLISGEAYDGNNTVQSVYCRPSRMWVNVWRTVFSKPT